jgi:phage portal protein BeeE
VGEHREQSIEALIYCVAPLLTATEQEYDRKLLAPPRLYCKHNVNALLRADMKTRAEFYGKMKEIGVYTTNMILAFEDENGIGPEGDQRFVPVNWQPADDLMTGGEAQQKWTASIPTLRD